MEILIPFIGHLFNYLTEHKEKKPNEFIHGQKCAHVECLEFLKFNGCQDLLDFDIEQLFPV